MKEGKLQKSLGLFSSFAAGLSYISILTGLFQMFTVGYRAGGGYFVFTWPFVLFGQMMVALMFSELAAEYPLEGGVFQWAKKLGGESTAFVVGVFYFGCLAVTLAAVPLALSMTLPKISSHFQVFGSTFLHNAIGFGVVLIVISTIVNAFGIRLLSFLNNIGVGFELAGIIFLIVLFFLCSKRTFTQAIIQPAFNKAKIDWSSFLTSAALTASYVLYGFDTAGTLAEETIDPRKKTPKAILLALMASGVGGFFIIVGLLMAVKGSDLHWLSETEFGPSFVVQEVLGETWGTAVLWVIILSITVCTMAVQTGASRLIYAMGRERKSRLAVSLSKLSKEGVPTNSILLTGIISIFLLLCNLDFAHVIESLGCVAVLWANLTYFVIALLYCRRCRQEKGRNIYVTEHKLFSLGSFRMPIAYFNVLWGTFMVVNVAWPRVEVYGEGFFRQYAAIIYTLILFVFALILNSKEEELILYEQA